MTLFSENSKSLIATSTFLPTIAFKIGLSFLTRSNIVIDRSNCIFFTRVYFLFFTHYYFLASAGLAFLSAGVCPKKVLVGANSPNLCPTISSEIVIGINFLPL